MKIRLELAWYNLDDSIAIGGVVELDVSAGAAGEMPVATFAGARKPPENPAHFRVVAIEHPLLGSLRSIGCEESFHYFFRRLDGEEICVNAEEEPGAIYDEATQSWHGHWNGRYLVAPVIILEAEPVETAAKTRPAKPLFSVLTPCYNARPYLRATYDSLHSQTVGDWEWIVADDGSTDGGPELVEELAKADPRVVLLRCPRAGRPAPGRNAALREARGEFIALLDADDLFEPTKLERQLAALRAHPDAGTYHEMESFWSEETGLDGVPPNGWQREPLDGATFEQLLVRGNFVPTSSIAVRRDLVTPETFMDEAAEYRGMEDYDFVLRFARQHPWVRVAGSLGRYRVHHNSLWSSANRAPEERLRKLDAVVSMLRRQGHLAGPGAAPFLAKHHLLRAESLLWRRDPACRRDFALTVQNDPANPRRWLGLLAWVLPLTWFRAFYFALRARLSGLPAADPLAR